jgi:hypothetical protein
MEHLTNCHGEWNALLAMFSSLPFIGIWARTKLYNHKEEL